MNDLTITVPQGDSAIAVFSGDFDTTLGPILAGIKAAVDAFEGDVSTAKGRQEIKSFAFALARSKTALDEAGKTVNARLKALPRTIDANRAKAWDTFEKWQAKVRGPLDEWERAEDDRKNGHVAAIEEMRGLARLPAGASSAMIGTRIEALDLWEPDRDWQEFSGQAELTRSVAQATLSRALVDAKRSEDQAAELARLRVAEEARAAEDRARREAEAERERQSAAERASAERVAQETERRIREAEERAAEAERRAEQARVDAERAAERARQDEQERAARERAIAEEAERRRVAQEKAAADDAERRRIAKEMAEQRRAECKADAVIGIMAVLVDNGIYPEPAIEIANAIVDKIEAGEVAFVTFDPAADENAARAA